MVKKAKEKSKKRNTKEDQSFNLDNEIIIGIKTLPEPKTSKQNQKEQTKKKQSQKSNQLNRKKSNHQKKDDFETISMNKKVQTTRKKNTHKKKKATKKKTKEEEFELKLGIEEEVVKKQNQKRKKPKMTTKQQEIAKRKRKIIFRVMKYTALLAILIGGGIYFMLSPFFNIKEITTSGNQKVTSEELISLSGIQLEENTFSIRSKQLIEKLKQNAYIDQVSIKRKLPDKIEIQITERTPTFMLLFANAYVYLNNQGYLLEVSQTPLDLPIIIGFLTPEEEIHPGNRLCSEDLQRLDHALQIMKSAQSNGIDKLITRINIADKQDYVLELKSEKKTVHMGDNSNLSTKMLYVISILEENKDIEGEIFVNTDLSNKGAIFRKKI